MINIKRDMIPMKYKKSRDYQVLIILLNLVINACKEDVDNFINLLNPDKCPDNMLPLLSDYIGYEYNYNDSYECNRKIISNYNKLIHNKGNMKGILLASILSLSCEDIIKKSDRESMFRVEYNKYKTDEFGNYIIVDGKKQLNDTINLYVYYPSYIKKLRDIIEIVRPAGIKICIIPALNIGTDDKIQIHDYVKFDSEQYNTSKRSEVFNPDSIDIHNYDDEDIQKKLNRVGFGEVDDYNEGDE